MGGKSRLQRRDAHARGRSIVVWDKLGKNLITAGADGKVLFQTWDLSVPSTVVSTIKAHNAEITCVALSPNGAVLATGSIDHSVKLYSYPGGSYQSTVTRFTLPIRCLGFSATGGILAAAGDDEGIKLIAMTDYAIARVLKGGYGSPVTSLAFDPKNEYLASVDSDGTVIFWLISSGKVLHTLTKVAPSIDVDLSESSNCVAWSPDGNLLAVSGRKSDLLLLDRDTAEEMYCFKGGHTSPVSALAWSLNGKYLATTGGDLQVVLWDVEKQQDIDGMMFDKAVCSVAWKPIENALAMIDVEGKFSVWESAVPPHMISPTICIKSNHVSSTNFEQLHKFSEDEASEGHGQSIDLGSEDTDGDDGDNDNEEGEDEEQGFVSSKKRRAGNSLSLEDVYDRKPAKAAHIEAARASFTLKVPPMQEAFQPGSTDKVEGRRRFLTYNLIGSISSCEKDGSWHVEVEFHDISKGLRIPAMADYFGYTMAALAETACVLASPHNGDKSPSTLTYRPFNSWATNSEWSMRFAANEEVKAVAVGNGWAAAATSSHFLRLYSEGGVQSFILSLPGPVVSMNGYQHQLVIVTHAANPLSTDDQAMSFMILDVQRRRRIMQDRLPLSSGSRLAWIGFSDTGSLGFYDSYGVLRRHFPDFGGSWVPIFRSDKEKKNSCEVFWMVGFDDAQAFGVICKLPEKQPLVFPRPILSFFKHSLPLAHADFGGEDLENDYLYNSLLLSEARVRATEDQDEEDNILRREIEHDKYVLRLLAAACKSDKLLRAMELASSLQLQKSLEGAIKVVNAMRLPSLADRLNLMLEKKNLQKDNREDVHHGVGPAHTLSASSWQSAAEKKDPPRKVDVITPQREVLSKPQNPQPGIVKEVPTLQKETAPQPQGKATVSNPSTKPVPDQAPMSAQRKANNPFAKSSTSKGGALTSKSSVLDSLKQLQNGNKRKEIGN